MQVYIGTNTSGEKTPYVRPTLLLPCLVLRVPRPRHRIVSRSRHESNWIQHHPGKKARGSHLRRRRRMLSRMYRRNVGISLQRELRVRLVQPGILLSGRLRRPRRMRSRHVSGCVRIVPRCRLPGLPGRLPRVRRRFRQLLPVPRRPLLQLVVRSAGSVPRRHVRQRGRTELLGLRRRLLQRARGAGVLPGLPGGLRMPRQGFRADQVLLGIVQLRERDRVRVLSGRVLLLEHWELAGGLHGRVLLAGQLGVLRFVSAWSLLHQHRSGRK